MDGDPAEPELSLGVKNPFVYAEHKSDKKIKWDEMSYEHKQKKLAEIITEVTYDQLFDPTTGSPLFVQTGDMRPCTTYAVNQWAPNPEGSNYFVNTIAYNDVVQGDLPDCYFIAALSSVAFATGLIQNQPAAPYAFNFYSPPAVEGGQPTQVPVTGVSNYVPLDLNNKYHYSRSFTAGEIWIAMYEKAFACWKNGVKDKPDYSKICTGDPVVALVNLTGFKFTTYKPGPDVGTSTATRYSVKDFGNDATKIFNKIKSACKFTPRVQYPMVAYTYDPRIESPPSGVTYNDATIVANHSYSVLGVYTVAPNNYIVMRNPWGQKGPAPGDPSGLPAGALASGNWNGVNLGDTNDAIFALRADVFRDYFKGFGWVYR
jgi:hypothetical protein